MNEQQDCSLADLLEAIRANTAAQADLAVAIRYQASAIAELAEAVTSEDEDGEGDEPDVPMHLGAL